MSDKLVEVYKAMGEMKAEIVKSMLESYGIPALLKSNAAPSAFVFTIDGMGEFKVMVREDMAEEARRLIAGTGNEGEDFSVNEPDQS